MQTAESIPVGHPGSISHLPEQVARLIRETGALSSAECAVLNARRALADAEEALRQARAKHVMAANAVGELAMRAGWVTPELVREVRP